MSVDTQTINPTLRLEDEQVLLTVPTDLMDAIRENGTKNYNQFIIAAIDFYLDSMRARQAELIAGYQANAEADAALAAEWSEIEDESWRLHVPAYDPA